MKLVRLFFNLSFGLKIELNLNFLARLSGFLGSSEISKDISGSSSMTGSTIGSSLRSNL